MHFHVPKPLHGWREFAGEVGIIVIGILIALGAEQVVEAGHERRIAGETRRALTEELNSALTSLSMRQRAEGCIGKRLSDLHALMDRWGETGTFKTPTWVAQAPSLNVTLTRYDAAVSAGRLAQLPPREQFEMGSIASGLRAFGEGEDRERVVWSRLRALQSGPRALSSTDRTALRMELQDASELDYHARLLLRQLLPKAAEWGYRPDMREFQRIVRSIWKTGRYTPAICAAIDTPVEDANRLTGQVTPLPQ